MGSHRKSIWAGFATERGWRQPHGSRLLPKSRKNLVSIVITASQNIILTNWTLYRSLVAGWICTTICKTTRFAPVFPIWMATESLTAVRIPARETLADRWFAISNSYPFWFGVQYLEVFLINNTCTHIIFAPRWIRSELHHGEWDAEKRAVRVSTPKYTSSRSGFRNTWLKGQMELLSRKITSFEQGTARSRNSGNSV